MSIFDLVFIVASLAVLLGFITVIAYAVSGRRSKALKLLSIIAAFSAAYVATNLAVSLLRPQKLLGRGEAWCFDDWCLEVAEVSRTATPPLAAYNVRFRIFSCARGVTQSAKGAWIFLMDERGNRYYADPDPVAVPLDVRLAPMESITSTRTFRVPENAHHLGLVTGHGGPYCGAMNILIIGQAGCVFNKPDMIRIQ